MYYSYRKTTIIVVVFTLVITSLILLIAYRNNDAKNNAYYLREYNGTVALFKNEELVEVYGGVVTDNLPFNDYKRFADGIKVSGIDEAQIIMEDYDG